MKLDKRIALHLEYVLQTQDWRRAGILKWSARGWDVELMGRFT